MGSTQQGRLQYDRHAAPLNSRGLISIVNSSNSVINGLLKDNAGDFAAILNMQCLPTVEVIHIVKLHILNDTETTTATKGINNIYVYDVDFSREEY